MSFRPGREDGPGTISPELEAAIDAVLGDDVHVSEWQRRSPGELPGVEIGCAPSISIGSGTDAMTVMRAIAALPVGARLIEPRDR